MDTWLKWYMTRIIFCIGTVTLVVCANTLRATSQTQVGAMFGMHAHGFCVPESSKIDENRGWMSLKSSKMEVWGSLWVAWVVFGEIWSGFLGKLSPRYAQDGLSER